MCSQLASLEITLWLLATQYIIMTDWHVSACKSNCRNIQVSEFILDHFVPVLISLHSGYAKVTSKEHIKMSCLWLESEMTNCIYANIFTLTYCTKTYGFLVKFWYSSTPKCKVWWDITRTQHSMFQGCAEALPPEFIFQEKTVRVILIWLGRRTGRWQAEKSEQTEVERCSAGDVPKQEAQWLDKWMWSTFLLWSWKSFWSALH